MNFNYGYERRIFEKKQAELREIYLAAGMSEEAIQEMYAFDRVYFNLRRKEIRHAAEPHEMIIGDADTGEIRRMDMDEFPTRQFNNFFEKSCEDWVLSIENERLKNAVLNLKPTYKKIIGLIIQGYLSCNIAAIMGVTKATISDKLTRIEKRLKDFL